MAEVTYAPATASDAVELAAGLRRADRAELAAMGLRLDAVGRSLECSTWSLAVRVDGRLGCVFGVAPLGGAFFSDVGVPWMLGTDLVRRHQRLLMRDSPAYIRAMLDQFPNLLNFVHAENVEAVRWLKRMGFTLHPAAPHGPFGALCHKFEMHHV